MADARKFLGGKWLRSEDIGLGKAVTVTIADVTEGEVQDKDKGTKHGWVLGFEGKDKSLFCNATNTNRLIELFGLETDDWVGQRIRLTVVKVDYAGKRVPALRVEPIPVVAPRRTVAPPPRQPEPDEPEAEGSFEELTADDIPF